MPRTQKPKPFQFSLKTLFMLTTGCAVYFALIKWVGLWLLSIPMALLFFYLFIRLGIIKQGKLAVRTLMALSEKRVVTRLSVSAAWTGSISTAIAITLPLFLISVLSVYNTDMYLMWSTDMDSSLPPELYFLWVYAAWIGLSVLVAILMSLVSLGILILSYPLLRWASVSRHKQRIFLPFICFVLGCASGWIALALVLGILHIIEYRDFTFLPYLVNPALLFWSLLTGICMIILWLRVDEENAKIGMQRSRKNSLLAAAKELSLKPEVESIASELSREDPSKKTSPFDD